MINLRNAKRIAIIGSSIEAWFTALTFRRISSMEVEVVVYDDEEKLFHGLSDGSLPVLSAALQANEINIDGFANASDLTLKLGSSFENWRSTDENDIFFHLFNGFNQGVQELDVLANRTYPLIAARIAKGLDLFSFYPGFSLLSEHASQSHANLALNGRKTGLLPAYHFDVHKAVNYLKNVALSRGIKHQALKIHKFLLDDQGNTTALNTNLGDIKVDFVVDASPAQLSAKSYKAKWLSFKDQFLVDRVLQFNIDQIMSNPHLFTRSIAMKCGWLQLVPLSNHLSGRYFIASKYTSDEAALSEVEQLLGHKILLKQKISFTESLPIRQGFFDKNWHKNVLTLGKASGFIEPLKSASMAQFFSLIYKVEQAAIEGHGILSETTIKTINTDYTKSFNEIADFTRLHYEGGRQDSSFWRDAKKLRRSKTYDELRKVFGERFPRVVDLENYAGYGWTPLFLPLEWLNIASAMGIITPQTALAELDVMPAEVLEMVKHYIQG